MAYYVFLHRQCSSIIKWAVISFLYFQVLDTLLPWFFFFIITEWQIWTHVSFAPQFSSAQFSRSVMSDSLQPHEPQHARPPCLSPTPGVHQTHVHQVGDAIQPSHPLLSLSPPALNLSQHRGLFQWVSSSHQVARVLECGVIFLFTFLSQHHGWQLTDAK